MYHRPGTPIVELTLLGSLLAWPVAVWSTDLATMDLVYQRGFTTTAIAGPPEGIAWDRQTGNLWVVTDSDEVFEVTTLGELVSKFTYGAAGALQDLDVLPGGNLLVIGGSRLMEITRLGNPAAGGIDIDLQAVTDSPEGVSFHTGTNTLFVTTGAPAVLELGLDGKLLNSFDTAGIDRLFTFPQGIGFEPETGRLLVVCEASKQLYVLSRSGERLRQFDLFDLGRIEAAEGIAVDHATGTIFVADTYWEAVSVFRQVPSQGSTPPAVEWETAIGGTSDDWGNALQVTESGAVIAGVTESSGAGGRDALLLKTDLQGKVLWQKTFGGAAEDTGNSVVVPKAGGLVLVGRTLSAGAGEADVYVVRTDGDGAMLWEKTFGGAGIDMGFSVVEAKDGGYVLAGETASLGAGGIDAYFLKIDAQGGLLLEKTHGETGDDGAEVVIESSDGGYILAGWSRSFGAGDMDSYVIKVDASGGKLWDVHFGKFGDDQARAVIEANDGSYVAAGYGRETNRSEREVQLVKLDQGGAVVWERYFAAGNGFTRSFLQSSDGGFLLACVSDFAQFRDPPSLGGNVLLVKTDSEGILTWQHERRAGQDLPASLQPAPGGGYILLGQTFSFGAGGGDVYLAGLGAESLATVRFRRGDVDASAGVSLTDAIYILGFLFLGGAAPRCLEASDTNDDKAVNLADAVYLLSFLFAGGASPPEPFESCGVAAVGSGEDLECESSMPCR